MFEDLRLCDRRVGTGRAGEGSSGAARTDCPGRPVSVDLAG